MKELLFLFINTVKFLNTHFQKIVLPIISLITAWLGIIYIISNGGDISIIKDILEKYTINDFDNLLSNNKINNNYIFSFTIIVLIYNLYNYFF